MKRRHPRATRPDTLCPYTTLSRCSVGQKPIVLSREINGFVLNRLQGALLNEAWALFDAGVASAADIDRTVSEGLGMRWSFMGPFETIDLNAPRSEEHTSELQSLMRISYAVFCLKKKTTTTTN